MNQSSSAVFDWLLGVWTITREVPGRATMDGVAQFTSTGPDTADYFEKVSVHLAEGQVLAGEQRYVFRRTDDGLAVYFHPTPEEVTKNSRRLFHQLHFVRGDAGSLRAEASHLCKEDVYRTSYVIDSAHAFVVRHTVRGPRKHYVLHTRYTRAVDLYTGSV